MSQFRGLTLYGTPLRFSTDPPEDHGYLVFLTEAQFRKARDAGIKLHWLRADDKDDKAYLPLSEPPP